MNRTLARTLSFAAVLSIASTARAQAAATEPAQTQAQSAQAANQDSSATPVRVHASHKVEVIAPGEHVESIIDRMRANSAGAATPDSAAATDHLPVRSPDLQRSTDRGAADRARGNHAGGAGAAPGAGPGSGPGAGPNGNGPPPERR